MPTILPPVFVFPSQQCIFFSEVERKKAIHTFPSFIFLFEVSHTAVGRWQQWYIKKTSRVVEKMKGKCSVDLTVTIGGQGPVAKVVKIHSDVAYIIPLTLVC